MSPPKLDGLKPEDLVEPDDWMKLDDLKPMT
jgi:hypothetical protein